MVTPMLRSGLLLKITNSIGVVGDNLLVQSLKSIPANYGQYRFLQKQSNRQATVKVRNNSHVSAQVSYSPTHSVERTETCPTSVYGQTTLQNLQRSMECPLLQRMLSWMLSTNILQRSMKIPCPVNLLMLYLDVSQTCWICKGQITRWMLHVHHPWQRLWTHAVFFRPVRPMLCSQGRQIVRWILQPMRNSVQSVLSRQRIQRRSMLGQTDSLWAKVQVLWSSSALVMPSKMMIPFMQ